VTIDVGEMVIVLWWIIPLQLVQRS